MAAEFRIRQGFDREQAFRSMAMKPNEKLCAIKDALGAPALYADGLLVYQGDAIELLSKMPRSLVNLAITSPPYNIGKQYEAKLELDDYVSWCEVWISHIHAATTEEGAFWLNVGYLQVPGKAKALPIPYLLWNHVDFFLIQEIVWNYGAGVASRKGFSPRNEKFLWYVKDENNYTFNLDAVRDPNVKYPNQKKNGKLKCNPLGKNPTDVWLFPKVTSGKSRSSRERTAHPAQFPLAVIDRIIKACSFPGDIVLDPFIGSGTTAEAALRNGRSVVGFEIRRDYIDIVAARIKAAGLVLQHDASLFETKRMNGHGNSFDGVNQQQLFPVDASWQP